MTQPSDEERDRRLVERVAAAWDPGPLGPGARAALEASLAERLREPGRPLRWAPALAAAAVAALASVWLLWGDGPGGVAPAGAPAGVQVAGVGSYEAWEYELLFPVELDDVGPHSDSAYLPDEYAALSGLLDAS